MLPTISHPLRLFDNHLNPTANLKLAGILTISTLMLVACGRAPTQQNNQQASQQTAQQAEQTTDSNAPNSNQTTPAGDINTLLNVSYDVARDFYKDFNPLFLADYQAKHQGDKPDIQMSHGGSSKQALSVANGLQADVVTMNQASDVEMLVEKGLVSADWREQFPNNAVPYTSTIVFLVRDGNPKGIHDWSDLAKEGVEIVLANPKTTGNGRYAFLGAYGYGLHHFNHDKDKTNAFVKDILSNVPVYENGGRAATTTFLQRGVGDVLLTFENEANMAVNKFSQGQVSIVYPSHTVMATNPVAVVNKVTEQRGTTEKAKAYLNHLWSDDAQQLAADLYLRPSNAEILAKNSHTLPKLTTFDPREVFGEWGAIMDTYFKDGGVFDQLATTNP